MYTRERFDRRYKAENGREEMEKELGGLYDKCLLPGLMLLA